MRLSEPWAVILDTGSLSLVAAPVGICLGDQSKAWFTALEDIGCRFYVPQMADYEVRRELIRAGKTESVVMLDEFIATEPDRYRLLTAADVARAAGFWARLRNANRGGSPQEALDADLLIAAQAEALAEETRLQGVVVATSNVRASGRRHDGGALG